MGDTTTTTSINSVVSTAETKVETAADNAVSEGLTAAQVALAAAPPSPVTAISEVVISFAQSELPVIKDIISKVIEWSGEKAGSALISVLGKIEKAGESIVSKVESEIKKIEKDL